MVKAKIEKQHRPRVHKILAHSYMVYLLALFFGLVFSAIMPMRIFLDNCLMNTSAVVLFLSTCVIFWAQRSTRKLDKENLTKRSFKNGPYKYTRNPTNICLFLSLISFGVIINSLFTILFALISFLLASLIFIKREEKLLERKYGDAYREYKKDVKF
jgi:protein-S-isoprenylcysteine O-methyltransferase Ste14